ncbi:MAG: hypothetical protein ACRCUZ_13520 [Shewanella sp.]
MNKLASQVGAVSRDEYRSLEHRVKCMIAQRWPASEIRGWVAALAARPQAVACAILRRLHPQAAALSLPPTAPVPNPFAKVVRQSDTPKSVRLLTEDGRPAGQRHTVPGLLPVNVARDGTVRCAVTARTLWIAPGGVADLANPGALNELNPRYRPELHQIVNDFRPVEPVATEDDDNE